MGIIIFHREIGFCTTLHRPPPPTWSAMTTTTTRFYIIFWPYIPQVRYLREDELHAERGERERALAAVLFFVEEIEMLSTVRLSARREGGGAKGYKPRVRLAITRVCCSTNPEMSESGVWSSAVYRAPRR